MYEPLQGAAAYVCQNTATPTCATMSVAALTTEVGIDPFPALSARVKDVAVCAATPCPEADPTQAADVVRLGIRPVGVHLDEEAFAVRG